MYPSPEQGANESNILFQTAANHMPAGSHKEQEGVKAEALPDG